MTHYSIIFILGLLIGSFLNAVIYRLDSGESIIKARSHCPKCGHVLAWYELVPVVSFAIQGGRCRSCREKISFQYPFVELATGVIFVALWAGQLFIFLYLAAVSSFLIIIFVYDLKRYIIPDRIIYPAILISGIWRAVSGDTLVGMYVALAVSSFFAAIFFVSRGKWLGFGDVKFAFFMGLFLGWPNILVALFTAFILGGIIGIGLVVSRRKTMKSQVPFGPFLVTGTFVAMFFGEKVVKWYLGLLI
ncbi:MAG: prepilin peptidase [Candidatus Spechtbacterales bacterium]